MLLSHKADIRSVTFVILIIALWTLTLLRVLQESVVLGYDAGLVLAQALAEVSNEEGWSQLFNDTPTLASSLLRHMKEV